MIIHQSGQTHSPRAELAPAELQAVADMTIGAQQIVDAINAQHRLAQDTADSALEHAAACGRLLLEQKSRVGHGNFMAWVARHCEFKQAQANSYMLIARNPDALGKSRAIRHLYPSGRALRSKEAPPPLPQPTTPAAPLVNPATLDGDVEQAIATLEADATSDSRRRVRELERANHRVKDLSRRLQRAEIAQRNAVAHLLAAARKLQGTKE